MLGEMVESMGMTFQLSIPHAPFLPLGGSTALSLDTALTLPGSCEASPRVLSGSQQAVP